MGEIYKITNLTNGKCYVGKTKHRSVIRWKDHVTGYHPSSLIHRAIVKYGVENFSFEVLERDINEDQLNGLEKYYISLLNSKTPNGYNLTDGGDGGLGLSVNEVTRLKQSKLRKGKPWSENRRNAGQKKLLNNKHSAKAVAMILDNGDIIPFDSATEASQKTGIYRTNISRACTHQGYKAGGYCWKYYRKD